MTSWVLSIGKDYPQHWDYAKREKVWDLRKRLKIVSGDTVYFWLAKKGLVGVGGVSRDLYSPPSTGLPWDDSPSNYKGRIDLVRLADYNGPDLSWGEIERETGITGTLPSAPHSDDSAVEARLRSLFGHHDLPESAEEALETLTRGSHTDLTADRRELVLAQIRLRQGQPAFRDDLLRAYNRQCAVTGTSSEAVLEAAHILPYRGVHTNVVSNGLLLRSDIHTLFDRLLLAVMPSDTNELVTRVSPDLADSMYSELDRRPLASVPVSPAQFPSPSYLRQHAEQCTWLR